MNPENPKLSPSDSLLHVFENHFVRLRMFNPCAQTVAAYRKSFNRLARFLNREPVITDLNAETMAGFVAWLGTTEASANSISRARVHCYALWRFAEACGASSNAPRSLSGNAKDFARLPPVPISRDERERIILRREKIVVIPREVIEAMTPQTPLPELLRAYVGRKLQRGHESTRCKFRSAMRELEFLLKRPAVIGDLNEESIDAVLSSVLETGRSVPTANAFRAKLLALARWAHGKGILRMLPDVDKLIEPRRVPIGWSRAQLRTLFRACSEVPGMIGGVPACDWWIALHACLYDSGERISAMLSARWDRLDLETGFLTIDAEGRKGKREDKSFPLHADTLAFLARIRLPQRELIFPWPYHICTIWNRYRGLLGKAKLPADRKHKFHCLRKTSASFFKAAGGDPVEHLGHSDSTVTRAYLVPSIVQTVRASELLERPYDFRPRLTDQRQASEREAS